MSKRGADEVQPEPTPEPEVMARPAKRAAVDLLSESEVFSTLLSGITPEAAATVVLKNCAPYALLALATLQREVSKKAVPTLEDGGAVVDAFLVGDTPVRAAALALLRNDPGVADGGVERAVGYVLALCQSARPADDGHGATPLTGDALAAVAAALKSRKDWPDGAAGVGAALRETLDKVALQGAQGAFDAATAAVRAGDGPNHYVDIGLDWVSLHTTCNCNPSGTCPSAAEAAAFLLAQSKKKASGAAVLEALKAGGAARKLARIEGRCPDAKALKAML